MSAVTFFRKFLQSPGSIGAITPSSHALAQLMCEVGGIDSARVIVEAGAGTGVFTREIVGMMPESAKFLSIEIDPILAETTRRANPSVDVVCDCASTLAKHLTERHIDGVDVIVSGLPWAAFPEPLQEALLTAFLSVLRPGGCFVTFAYLSGLPLPAGRRFSQKLDHYFETVERTAPVWTNLPPAIVYKATTANTANTANTASS